MKETYLVYANSATLRGGPATIPMTGSGGQAFSTPIVDCTADGEPSHVWPLAFVGHEDDMFFLSRGIADECGTIQEARDFVSDWWREREAEDEHKGERFYVVRCSWDPIRNHKDWRVCDMRRHENPNLNNQVCIHATKVGATACAEVRENADASMNDNADGAACTHYR
jgi:hypothetical protein